MNNTIKIEINGQFVKKSSKNAGAAGSGNAQSLDIIFDESWLSFGKRIIWRDAKGENETALFLYPKQRKTTLYIKRQSLPKLQGKRDGAHLP